MQRNPFKSCREDRTIVIRNCTDGPEDFVVNVSNQLDTDPLTLYDEKFNI